VTLIQLDIGGNDYTKCTGLRFKLLGLGLYFLQHRFTKQWIAGFVNDWNGRNWEKVW